MFFDEMRAELLERLLRSVRAVEELHVAVRDRSPFGHRAQVEHLIPVFAAVQNHLNVLGQFVGLYERENLEQLVAGAEAAGKHHERFGQVRKPELPHEEIVELEMESFGDVWICSLLERQANVQADRLAPRF